MITPQQAKRGVIASRRGWLGSARRYLQKRVRASCNPVLLRLCGGPRATLEETLVVAGSPRSGTTWLAEVVASLPRTALLFEPLHARVPQARALRGGPLPYVPLDDPWPEGQALFEQILHGEIANAWTTRAMPLSRAVRPRRWVVKFIHANLLLGWLASRFPVRPPALIIRHPCAVVASQLEHGLYAHLDRLTLPDRLAVDFPGFADALDGLKSRAQLLAAMWSIQQCVPLRQAGQAAIHLVSYERLVRDGLDELRRLFTAWNLPLESKLGRRLRVPSAMTLQSNPRLDGADSLAAWQRKLTTGQIDQILDVVGRFGLDFYDERPEPDYDRLDGALGLRAAEGP